MNKHILLIFLLSLCGAAFAKDYSFEQALERAYLKDDAVVSAQKDLESAKAEKTSSSGLYWPTIGVKGQYTNIDAPLDIDLNEIRSAVQPLYDAMDSGVILPDFTKRVQDERFFKAQAYATLPLYTGGKIRAANMASLSGVNESEARFELLKNNILADLSAKYFGAVLAGEVVKVRSAYMENTRELADNGAKMYETGVISKVEKMATDLAFNSAKRDYQISLNDASLANNLLKNALHETDDITFNSALFICDVNDIEPLEYFKEAALSESPVLKVYDSKETLADANIKAQTSGLLPTVYLFGYRELYDEDLTILDPEYAYGAGVQWDIFSGGSSGNKRKSALLKKDSLLAARAKQETDIETYVEYYYKKMQNAIFKHASALEETALREELLRVRTLAFKTGTGTSLEVDAARTQLLKSHTDTLNAQYEFVTSLAGLLSISGKSEMFENYRIKNEKHN